ncbi:hypothetical protein [Enemella evansiae]|uniref:hypothetical protein n=1 Tax=Enemella evansiae TaxID=2016499 RepID=UPI000B96A87D|nr:hypothetical protein [Enemella evansiae]OYO02644.1 hypothetical protein CGZ97_14670 [Enemella evansiae]
MIPDLGDDELTAALGRTPGRRERQRGAETIWFDADRVLLADLAVPGADAAMVFDGLREAAARTGHLSVVFDEPPIRAMVVPAGLPGAQQAVAGDDTSVLTLVLPRGFPATAADAAARLLAGRLRDRPVD